LGGSGLVAIALLVLAYAAVSRRLLGSGITPAMVFVAGGLLASTDVLGWLDPTIRSESVRWLAEATLTVVPTIFLTVALSVLLHGVSAMPLARRYAAWFAAHRAMCSKPSRRRDSGRIAGPPDGGTPISSRTPPSSRPASRQR
jgi:NhaP-type Na+/H+ or K+/H+ antiporter